MKFSIKKEYLTGYLFISPTTIALLLLVIYPIVYGIVISLFNTNLINKWDFVGFKYFIDVLFSSRFHQSLAATFHFTFFTVIGNFIVGIALAVILNKNLPGSLFFKTILIVPWLFPEVVVGLLWKWMFNSIYGIINHFLTIANVINEPVTWLGNPDSAPWAIVITAIWKGYPIVMIFVLAGLQTIPKELYEAANLDGASKVQTFFFITIPMIKPILLVTLVLETVWWLKHFTLIWLLTQGGPVNATNVVSISIFRSAFESFRFGQAAATAVLVFFICIFISKLYKTLITTNENE